MTEKEYRKLHRLSYSWLKMYIDDRLRFYEEFEKATEFVDRKETPAMKFGTLVDTLLLSPELFDERFEHARFKKPTGQMGQFVDKLYTLTLENCSADGIVSRNMTSLMEEAYNLVAYDASGDKVAFKRKSLDQVIQEFANSEAEKYYNQQRESNQKHLVDVADMGRAQAVIDKLLRHPHTRKVFFRDRDPNFSVHKQTIILFTLFGLEFKAMPDWFDLDHANKVVSLYDLKTTSEVEDWNYNYRKFKYYLQGLVYYYAVKEWMDLNGFGHYRLELPAFIVAHSSNAYDPLIWQMNRTNMLEAMNGFIFQNEMYMGLRKCIEAIGWHRENNVWTMTKDNYLNNGICQLKTYADESI